MNIVMLELWENALRLFVLCPFVSGESFVWLIVSYLLVFYGSYMFLVFKFINIGGCSNPYLVNSSFNLKDLQKWSYIVCGLWEPHIINLFPNLTV